MKNTLDTIATPGRGLDQLEGRPDRLRGRVRRAGDHPVGHPERDHHRAEVGDVGDDVARRRRASCPCARGARCTRPRSARAASWSVGIEHVRAPQVERRAATRGAPHLVLGAEQRELDHAPAQQRLGRAQHPLVGALGQHDVLLGRPRAIEQRVLEHQRRDRLRARDVDAVEQVVAVDVGPRTAPAPW